MNNFFSLSILFNLPLLLLLLLLLLPMIIIIIIIHIHFFVYWKEALSYILIHQIFLLAHDWSWRILWQNFPQLKLGDIRKYLPGDIPQISNLISITISFCFKFISSWESLIIVTEQGKHLLVHRAVPENTPNKTSPVVKRKLYVRSPTLQNIWKIMHTIFSILHENILIHLSLDITCSSKSTVSESEALGKLLAS